MKYYPVKDILSHEDLLSLGVQRHDVTYYHKVASLSDIDGDVVIMAKNKVFCYSNNDINNPCHTFRCPKAGEWFLSGATDHVEAYKSTCDLSTSFNIAELVLVKTITITTQVEVTL